MVDAFKVIMSIKVYKHMKFMPSYAAGLRCSRCRLLDK